MMGYGFTGKGGRLIVSLLLMCLRATPCKLVQIRTNRYPINHLTVLVMFLIERKYTTPQLSLQCCMVYPSFLFIH